MSEIERHVFICVNERPAEHPKGSCIHAGGQKVRDRFKDELKARGLHTRMRANRAGCLNYCAAGVTVVVYPEAVWYGQVAEDDVVEIIESHLIGGQPVERLRLTEEFFALGPAGRREFLAARAQTSSASSRENTRNVS